MNMTKKPIKKCNGCPLNFKSHCGVFEIPRQMWARGKCPGYFNDELLISFKATQAQIAAKEQARRRRQEVQALRKTEPHYSGHLYSVVASDNPSDRKKSAALHANYLAAGKHAAQIARIGSIIAARRTRATAPRRLR